jgi:Ca-activated chloride channel homolog
MVVKLAGSALATKRRFRFGVIGLTGLVAGSLAAFGAEEKKPAPCTEDAMIVFDASGSMSGNQTLGIPNSRARIDEVRAALAQVLPSATQHRRVGLITYGPGPYNQCNVKLDLKPTPDAAKQIMSAVNALVPAGKTPLTSAVEQAADVLNYRSKPGVIVVVTDGEETCGGSPCTLAKQLHLLGDQLTVHVIAFRYDGFSWTGGNSVMDLMCLADENHGLYSRANSEEELVEALEKTLDCPMVSQASPTSLGR